MTCRILAKSCVTSLQYWISRLFRKIGNKTTEGELFAYSVFPWNRIPCPDQLCKKGNFYCFFPLFPVKELIPSLVSKSTNLPCSLNDVTLKVNFHPFLKNKRLTSTYNLGLLHSISLLIRPKLILLEKALKARIDIQKTTNSEQ